MAADENTFFKVGPFGVTRSTDGGKSWNLFTKGIVGTRITNLMAFRNGLYINTGTAIAKSTDGGESWIDLRINSGELTLKPVEKERPTDFLIIAAKLTISGDILYGVVPKVDKEIEPNIFYLSANGSILVPIQGVPSFPSDLSIKKKRSTASQEAVPGNIAENTLGNSQKDR